MSLSVIIIYEDYQIMLKERDKIIYSEKGILFDGV